MITAQRPCKGQAGTTSSASLCLIVDGGEVRTLSQAGMKPEGMAMPMMPFSNSYYRGEKGI
jgi:hypothetical protein